MIKLSRPYINYSNCKARLVCDIEYESLNHRGVGCEKVSIIVEVDKEYEKYLCYERSDAFLIAILPLAMRINQDIVCCAPVTEQLLHNITMVLVPQLAKYDPMLNNIKITASTDSALMGGDGVGTGLSCGVDSFHTILSYINTPFKDFKLTHLCNFDVGSYDAYQDRNETKARSRGQEKAVSDSLGLPIIFLDSNIMPIMRNFVGRHKFIHTYYSIFAVFALRKLWKIYYYASTYDLSHFSIIEASQKDSSYYDLLSSYCFTVPDLRIYIGGINEFREEKLLMISDSDIVKKYLHVCVRTAPKNCNICFKCRRTLLMLDMLGKLEEFRDVFDIDYYNSNRVSFYFRHLIMQSENNFLKSVYAYFMKKEPKLMARAMRKVKRRMGKKADLETKGGLDSTNG